MIAEMKKVTIAAPNTVREQLLQFLQEETVMHVDQYNQTEQGTYASDSVHLLAQLQFAISFIEQIEKRLNIVRKKKLKDMFVGKPTANLAELDAAAQKIDIPLLIARVEEIHNAITQHEANLAELAIAIAQAEPWIGLGIHNSQSANMRTPLIHRLLSITAPDDAIITRHLESIPTGAWQEAYRSVQKNSVTIFGELVAHRQDEAHVDAFEQALNAERITLPSHADGSMKSYHARLVRESKQTQKALAQIVQQASELLPMRMDILFAYDGLLHKVEREKLEEHITSQPFITVISGWIPSVWLGLFSTKLQHAFPEAALESADVAQEDRAPVMFQNNKLIRPFEAVTDLYGKPAYHELDPSGPLAIFFLISFGLALTDAGYGVIMMIGTFIAERFFKLKRDMQKLVRVLFYAGAATVVLGGLTGGWFSIDLITLPDGAIKQFLLGIKLIDPLKQPILLLGIIFAFGIVQLVYAWIVRGMYHWKRGEKTIAILDDFSWAVMVGAIILWIASSNVSALQPYIMPAKYFMYAVALFMIATQGRSAKNIFVKIGNGTLSLYGLIAFVSDMLSYSRLLALGLATGIIGLVVNLIAGMVSSSIPVVGIVLVGVVLLVGHVFNLGINALGGYIHSGRLQFVEFFPKFLEGGGLPFRPFGRVGKYVDNPKDYVKAL